MIFEEIIKEKEIIKISNNIFKIYYQNHIEQFENLKVDLLKSKNNIY